jgi:uncharacterized phage-associated protein
MALDRTPPYDAKAVANYFLGLAEKDGKTLDPMKIQKLVYLAHGWYLALTGKPLVTERIEAWLYGPVIRSLYSAFQDAGSGPIQAPAREAQFADGKLAFVVSPRIQDSASDETRQILDEVWRVYGGFTAVQLSNLTHQPGSPWEITWNSSKDKEGLVIDDKLIQQYFENQARVHEPA